jgi:hypothetical protein
LRARARARASRKTREINALRAKRVKLTRFAQNAFRRPNSEPDHRYKYTNADRNGLTFFDINRFSFFRHHRYHHAAFFRHTCHRPEHLSRPSHPSTSLRSCLRSRLRKRSDADADADSGCASCSYARRRCGYANGCRRCDALRRREERPSSLPCTGLFRRRRERCVYDATTTSEEAENRCFFFIASSCDAGSDANGFNADIFHRCCRCSFPWRGGRVLACFPFTYRRPPHVCDGLAASSSTCRSRTDLSSVSAVVLGNIPCEDADVGCLQAPFAWRFSAGFSAPSSRGPQTLAC